MEDIIKVVGIIIVLPIVIIAAVTILVLPLLLVFYPMEVKTCSVKYQAFENRYDFWAGCQIRINDKWIPADSYYIKENVK